MGLDRLGPSLKDLAGLVWDLQARGVAFSSLNENIDTGSAGGKLIFHVFAALEEFERSLIRERTHAGLAAARARGRKEAVGEVFRRRGKTDICIEQDDRAAFVGECKIWTGPVGLCEALDQLLGYLTWRDSKASLIIFNLNNKNFSRILAVVPETLRRHPLFVSELPCHENGEWRVQMRSEEDAGRGVTVQLFVFDLHQSP